MTPDIYRRQVALLIATLPFVAPETDFAIKGGTAINLFVRDMPRLSVDIDLAWLPLADRRTSLQGIDTALGRIAERIADGLPGCLVRRSRLHRERTVNKLLVRMNGVQVKIEVTPVLRGCVDEPCELPVSRAVEDAFGYAEATIASFGDLYAGKLVAALDRQHPRDLFDVRDLLAKEGITERLRDAFLVYVISHNRPMADILDPTRRDISAEFRNGLLGMTSVPVTLDELLDVRERLVDQVVAGMPESHRRFLVSFERGTPDWSALDVAIARQLPAVLWRLENVRKLSTRRRDELVASLRSVWVDD